MSAMPTKWNHMEEYQTIKAGSLSEQTLRNQYGLSADRFGHYSVAPDKADGAPVIGQPDLVNQSSADPKGPQPGRDQDAAFDLTARRGDGGPAAVRQATLLGELRRDLAEQFGLQLGQPGEPA